MNELVNQYMADLFEAKQQIKQAIINKGGVIEGGLSSYAEAINSIVTGGGGEEDVDLGTVSKTIDENGSYVYYASEDELDGYSTVVVNVDVPEQHFATQSKEVKITKNGSQTVTPDDGYDGLSEVSISVEVSGGGGGKPMIPNGFVFTGGDMSLVDFSQYDWSNVYDTSYFFQKCTNTGDWSNFEENFNGEVLSGYYMFQNNDRGSYTPNTLPFLDTSNMLTAEYMFNYCNNITSIPNYDFSSVLNAKDVFSYCEKLESLPPLNFAECVDLTNAFYGCKKLTSLPAIYAPKCLRTSSMFDYCNGLNSVDGDYDFRTVTNTYRMFAQCSALKTISGLRLRDATEARYMFSTDSQLTDVSIDFTGMIGSCSADNMFESCSKLVNVSLDGIKVKNCASMFMSCGLLEELDASSWDFSDVSGTSATSGGFYKMFSGDTNLVSVKMDLSNNPNSYTVREMFYNCKNLSSVDIVGMRPISTQSLFYKCERLVDYSFLSTWDFSKTTSTNSMFFSDVEIDGLKGTAVIPSLDTSNVTDMSYMFYKNLNISKVMGIDLSSTTTASYMFDNCSYLGEIYLKGNPSKLTSVSSMFGYAIPVGYKIGGCTVYYDSRYDYSKIIAEANRFSTITMTPYNFE